MQEKLIKDGYVYHIRDLYFEMAKDNMLMRNHEDGAYRPTYLCLQDEKTGLFWAIPMSTRIFKFKPIIDKDTEKYGRCVKMLIGRYGDKESVFLFQNMFPITAKYIDHIHTIGGKPVAVELNVKRKIIRTFKECLRLHKRGVKVIFTNIEQLEQLMLTDWNES